MPGKRKSDPLADSKVSIHKDEVIVLHRTLFRIRRNLEALGVVPDEAFAEYDRLGVTPLNIDRARGAHRLAILALSKGFRACAGDERVENAWRRL